MQFISKANNRKWPDLQINDRWEFSKIFAGFSFYKTPFLWKRIHWPDLFLGIINEWESPCFQIQVFPGRWLSFFLPFFSHRLGEKYLSHRLGHFNYWMHFMSANFWARQQFCSDKKVICQLGLSCWVQMNNLRNWNTACNTCGFSWDKNPRQEKWKLCNLAKFFTFRCSVLSHKTELLTETFWRVDWVHGNFPPNF